MRREPLSLFAELYRLDARLQRLPCPICKADRPLPILRRDRYMLRVDLSLCQSCGGVYLARGMGGDDAVAFYGDLYPRLMRMRDPPPATLGQLRLAAGYRVNAIRNVAGFVDDVVDIGSGHGFFLAACREGGSVRFYGVEPGSAQRKFAEEKLSLRGCVHDGDFASPSVVPFRPAIVTLFHVLEHLDDPGATLDIIVKSLAPGGWLVIEVPDLEDWSEIGLQYVHVSHRSYFTARSLTALLRRHGFRVDQVQTELHGIHPTNLRIFARAESAAPAIDECPELIATRDRIRRQIAPWRFADGYLRSVYRLGKLALNGA